MKSRISIFLSILALLAFACAKNESNTTDTGTSTTVSATDTSATTSTTDTSATGTSATSATTAMTSTAPLGDADKTTVTKIAQANMAEVAAGQMAATKATASEVKDFANKMVQDHGKAGEQLSQLATSKGATLPTEVDAEHKAAADKMSKLSGLAFDKAYMAQMVKDHEGAVKAFEDTSKNAKDPDLKNWATQTLPTIQDHLKMAKDINAKLK
jgi:putative membrane protein